jgi:hypothetical protein
VRYHHHAHRLLDRLGRDIGRLNLPTAVAALYGDEIARRAAGLRALADELDRLGRLADQVVPSADRENDEEAIEG